jgi:hypothetical protein
VEAIGSPIPLTDSVSSGFTPRSIAVGHFRAGIDKPLDILVVGQGEMRILFGDGTGQFAPSPNSPPITLPLRADPSSVIVGNFNFHNDGRDDIAFKVDPVNGPPSVQILFNNGIGQFPTGTSLSIRLVCHPLADQRIACQTLGMSPLINNSFGKAPGPVILSFLNLTSIVGGIDEVDPRLQAAYGVVKDSSSQQLNLQQCVPEACQDSDLPELPACGMKKGGWLINSESPLPATPNPIAIDMGNDRLSLVLTTQGQRQCSNMSIVVVDLSTKPEIVCGAADCVRSIPFDIQPEGLVGIRQGPFSGDPTSGHFVTVLNLTAGKFTRNQGIGGPDIALLGMLEQFDGGTRFVADFVSVMANTCRN